MTERKKILPQMFDVRPVDGAGDLDLEKIEKMEKIVTLAKRENNSTDKFREKAQEKTQKRIEKKVEKKKPAKREYEVKQKTEENWRGLGSAEYLEEQEERDRIFRQNVLHNEVHEFRADIYQKYKRDQKKTFPKFNFNFTKGRKIFESGQNLWRPFFKWGVIVVVIAFACNVAFRGWELKKNGLADAQAATGEILAAKDSLKSGDFEKAYTEFNEAHQTFAQIASQFNGMGKILVDATKYTPYLSKLSSGSHLVRAGEDVSDVGLIISGMLKNIPALKASGDQGSSISYLKIFSSNEDKLKQVATLLDDAQNNLDSVNLDDLPEKDRSQFVMMKQTLPEVNNALAAFLGQEKLFNDILGGNGPRKYLFLFQNNQEIRATGGFIGSYGLLDIFDGRVRKFFIDGVFNPDGQLRTKIVPPVPVQKISANWSLHDSNWFPNFPTSAEKAAWFYEKAGGPTVDGVITMTPTVMQKLLEVTGPIEMPEYGITVGRDNFIQEVQYQVEVDYDKELNNPKKILGDLAPKILDKILNMKNFSELSRALNVMLESVNEKQILIYSKNPDIEKTLAQNGWSGEILDTPKDYLSVINTNINGFKTDGVVEEKISHQAEIRADGSVIDTLTVVRHHNGGDTPYEWWNKVNSDYMRVYVPQGAQLLRAEGQTREVDAPPLDYNALGYAKDPQVQAELDSAQTDSESGTKIYEDSGKTVFANWVYVSPKETVTLKYVYLLPFKITMNAVHISDTYSLLAQKQSGSLGSGFSSEVNYPSAYKTLWQSPDLKMTSADNLPNDETGLRIETDLKTDKFIGVAFTK